MRRLTGAIAVSCLVITTLGSPHETLNIPVLFRDGLSGYLEVEASAAGGPLRQENRERSIVWANNLFDIQVTQERASGQRFLQLHVTSPSRTALGIDAISLHMFTPAARIDGVWTPSGHVSGDRLISADPGTEFVTQSAANYGIPYLAAATAGGKNVLALGLLQQDLMVQLRTAPAENGSYEFQIRAGVPPNRAEVDHQFFVSADPSYSWFEIAQKYADWVDAGTNYTQFPVTDRAYIPVYDTWYWSKDAVDDHLYMRAGEAASQAGLGIFLADSGWDTPAGEYNKWLLGSTGNYLPPPDKFPNLTETFDTLRSAFHLKIDLWLQPFAVGRASTRYPETQGLHIQIPKSFNSASLAPYDLPEGPNTLEDVNLCPQLTATHRYLKDLFAQIASMYHPEGYWLDFFDGMPPMCEAPHRHDFDTFGVGFGAALRTIRDTILEHDASPIVEFRAQYANLNNKSFANVWQPFDSPYDFDRMRLDALRLRPFSKGVVFAADELYWPETINDAGVARFVMTDVMTGVPSIGANLVDSRPLSIEIVKNWMNFYKKYQRDLTTGQLRPFGSFRVPNHSIESDSRIFVYIRSRGKARFSVNSRKQIFLMNASDVARIDSSITVSDSARYEMQAYSHYLQPQGAPTEAAANKQGILDISAVVQRGGILVLTPIDSGRPSRGYPEN